MKNLAEILSPGQQSQLLGEVQGQEPEKLSLSWPEPLQPEALHGLVGMIVNLIEPHTEADPAALLFSVLTMYGNIIGRNAYFQVEGDRHYTNLNVNLVGSTSKGRKGTSLGQARKPFAAVDPIWTDDRNKQGLSSGEGLIWQVRDEKRTTKTNKKGETYDVIEVDGVNDKRLLIVEPEFASVARVLRRDGNTLSAVMRQAWDGANKLNTLTKNSPAEATGAHISILGHVTKDELLRYLDSVEGANGFGNRFLWVCVKRSKFLPDGGQLKDSDFNNIILRMKEAVGFGSRPQEIKRDDEARDLWHKVYPELSSGNPGLFGAMTGRAEAQVTRLALIYALLDCSCLIRVEHLMAALAAWDYAEASAKYIFGNSLGDPVADEILKALDVAGNAGMTRTDISDHFGRNKGASEIGRAINLLYERGMIRSEIEEKEIGRPSERWFKN